MIIILNFIGINIVRNWWEIVARITNSTPIVYIKVTMTIIIILIALSILFNYYFIR
jgi:hypothetical protein